jgi:O-antigen ligase
MQSTHNAWLQAALVFGVPFALAILLAFGAALARLRYGWNSTAFLPALVAFHLAGLFFFEEHLNNPTFVILTTWVVLDATIPVRSYRSMRAP